MSDKNIITKLLALLILFFYLLLLVPTIIVSNVGESGIILESQYVQFQLIPHDVQDILPNKVDYHITIVESLSSDEQYAIISQQMPYNEGDFIKALDVTAEWYSDSHIFSSLVHKPFDKIIISDVERVNGGGWLIEAIAQLKVFKLNKVIYIISSKVFIVGGLLTVLILSFLLKGGVALWNISGILSCYTFQYFYASIISFLNQIDVNEKHAIFGLLFLALLPFTLWLQRYENTENGQTKILEMHSSQKRFFSMLIGSSLMKTRNHMATIKTNKGTIEFELFEDKAPITASNFIALAQSGFYDGLTFHKVVPALIQTGDPTGTGTGGSGRNIPLEINLKLRHVKGAVVMARSTDHDSASSQFYITLKSLPHLDREYAVFGQVIKGMDVAKNIKQGDVIHRIIIDIKNAASKDTSNMYDNILFRESQSDI